ncbi:MAG: hypothetical protein IJ303_05045, partial [Clostridia bacterium]|nr:hypothetical protein [Clostridia bacterium]
KKKKSGYTLAWLTYFILSAIYLAIEYIHPEYLFNSYSLDFWFNILTTLLALINGEIMEIKNTVNKLYND